MKKISNEVIVGTVAIIVLAAFIYTYNFLKGSELFTQTDTYHVIYSNINGLEPSSPVEINGYQAGIVQDISFINDGTGRLAVTISVNKGFDLPVGTTAEITTATLIAGMKIVLHLSESQQIHQNHDTLNGQVATSVIDKLSQTFSPVEGNLTDIIVKLDSVISSINDLFTPQMASDIQASLSNVNAITANAREITSKEKEQIMAALEDIRSFTAVLSKNSAMLDATIRNLAAISDTIATSDLSGSLASLRSSLAGVDSLVTGMSRGEGTAGKLMTDDSLYVNLNNTLYSLDMLLKDLKENPKKYVQFSVF